MNTKTALAAMMVFGSIGGSLVGGGPTKANPISCASGYYADAMGNCQPTNGYVDSRCQNGFIAQPAFNGNGYRCVPESHG